MAPSIVLFLVMGTALVTGVVGEGTNTTSNSTAEMPTTPMETTMPPIPNPTITTVDGRIVLKANNIEFKDINAEEKSCTAFGLCSGLEQLRLDSESALSSFVTTVADQRADDQVAAGKATALATSEREKLDNKLSAQIDRAKSELGNDIAIAKAALETQDGLNEAAIQAAENSAIKGINAVKEDQKAASDSLSAAVKKLESKDLSLQSATNAANTKVKKLEQDLAKANGLINTLSKASTALSAKVDELAKQVNNKPLFSCRDAFQAGKISSGQNADVTLSVRGTPSKSLTFQCIWDGSNVYTHIKCTSFSGSCKRNHRATDSNTCKDNGYHLTPYRSKNHYMKLTSKYGRSRTWFKVSNVYRPSGGCGSCTGSPMRSGGAATNSGWRTFDGGAWWLRDSRYSEPNGDYHGNCWLEQYDWNPNNVRFNDGNCQYWTNRYICIDSSK